jgi:hypothetical protein
MNTLINIIGAGRSGSTMLGLMLNSAPGTFYCGEVYAWFRPWRTHHYHIKCACGQDPCPYWEKIKDVPQNIFHQEVLNRLNRNYVIDSSKEHTWIIDNNYWAQKNQLRAVNLVLWKDPLDLAYSHWKRNRGVGKWREIFIQWYKLFFEIKLPFISVSYNGLIENPSKKLRDICNITGINYMAGMKRFWEKQHHHLFGSLGTRKQLISNQPSKIHSKREFPPDFQMHANKIRQSIHKDTEIQGILNNLEQSEVSVVTKEYFQLNTYSKPMIYPWWYYLKKVKQVYKKRFPDNWPFEY